MRRLLVLAPLLLAAAPAAADGFRSVAENAVVLYDAPSRQAKPVFVLSRGYPVEVIVNLDAWVKVRDHAGALSWVERKALSERRTVLVTAPAASVHAKPEEAAAVVFSAQQNVAMDLVEAAPGGWLRVRHADGAAGFVRANQVWGD
jgi:SH3-like domain-containing protein